MVRETIFTKHDSIWGTDVPNDHKLWTNGQKVSLALFPWLGTGKLMLRMETFDYRFEQSVNSTRDCVDIIQTLSVDEYLDNLSFKNSNLMVTMMFIFCEQKGNERQMKSKKTCELASNKTNIYIFIFCYACGAVLNF